MPRNDTTVGSAIERLTKSVCVFDTEKVFATERERERESANVRYGMRVSGLGCV